MPLSRPRRFLALICLAAAALTRPAQAQNPSSFTVYWSLWGPGEPSAARFPPTTKTCGSSPRRFAPAVPRVRYVLYAADLGSRPIETIGSIADCVQPLHHATCDTASPAGVAGVKPGDLDGIGIRTQFFF